MIDFHGMLAQSRLSSNCPFIVPLARAGDDAVPIDLLVGALSRYGCVHWRKQEYISGASRARNQLRSVEGHQAALWPSSIIWTASRLNSSVNRRRLEPGAAGFGITFLVIRDPFSRCPF